MIQSSKNSLGPYANSVSQTPSLYVQPIATNRYVVLKKHPESIKKQQDEALIEELKAITKRYKDYLESTHRNLFFTYDSELDCNLITNKHKIVSNLMGYLNQSELTNFKTHLETNKDTIAAHRTPGWQRFLDAVFLTIVVAAIATLVAVTFDINLVTALVSAMGCLVAAVLVVQRTVDTNSFNFFASHGANFTNEAERCLANSN